MWRWGGRMQLSLITGGLHLIKSSNNKSQFLCWVLTLTKFLRFLWWNRSNKFRAFFCLFVFRLRCFLFFCFFTNFTAFLVLKNKISTHVSATDKTFLNWQNFKKFPGQEDKFKKEACKVNVFEVNLSQMSKSLKKNFSGPFYSSEKRPLRRLCSVEGFTVISIWSSHLEFNGLLWSFCHPAHSEWNNLCPLRTS